MPDQTVPTPEYAEEQVLLAVEAPTASRSTLRLRAGSTGVCVAVDLTLSGASALAELLRSASVAAVAAADFPTAE